MQVNNRNPLSFAQALRQVPTCVAGGYDRCEHTTVESLGYMVRLQVHLYLEGETGDIHNRRQLNACIRFVQRCGLPLED